MRKLIYKLFVIVLLAVAFWIGNSDAYTPPKGIPNPSSYFSTFGEIDQSTPDSAMKCPSWPDQNAGCYYIDNTHPSSTDSANAYGYPNKPRKTLESRQYNAGDFIYFNGGSYAGTNVCGTGTAANPIWITGNPSNRPKFTKSFGIGYIGTGGLTTSYIVFENMDFERDSSDSSGLYICPGADYCPINHIIVRNCTLTGLGKSNNLPVAGDTEDNVAITIGAGGRNVPNSPTQYIVVYNTTISNFGYIGDLGVGGEEAGVYHTEYTSYVWTLNSTIYNIGGDGIAGCHTCSTEAKALQYLFIGGNTVYTNGENCIDLKNIHHFIVSENDLYGPHQDEQGWAAVFHSSQTEDMITPSDGWFIFNKVHHVSSGVVFASSPSCKDMYVAGNLFYDIKASYAGQADLSYNGPAIVFASSDGDAWAVDNTIYDCDYGIKFLEGYLDSNDHLKAHGNIISNRSDAGGYEIGVTVSGAQAYVDIDYNQVYYPSGSAAFNWGGVSRNLAYIQETASECIHCAEGNPLFVDAPTNLGIQTSSPCKDTSVEGPVGGTAYDAFMSSYGENIEKDRGGVARPQNSLWDIGAYEYYAEGADVTYPTIDSLSVSGSIVYLNKFIVSWTCSDAVGVAGQKWRADAVPNASSGTALTTSPETISGTLVSGDNDIYVGCYDAAGNYGTAKIPALKYVPSSFYGVTLN